MIIIILSGKEFSEFKIKQMKAIVDSMEQKPVLALIKIGDDAASERYVRNKIKRCEEVGIESEVYEFGADIKQELVEELIHELNSDKRTTAILLQLPLPDRFDEEYLTNQIAPNKDVDGFTIWNTGKLSLGMDCNVACTPRGIIELLKFYDIPIKSRDVVIVNASNIVGKPLAQLFLKEGATPTICHIGTTQLKKKIKAADIVVLATGNANFMCANDFSDNTVIIDVSINFDDNDKMCGDVVKTDYDKLLDKGCHITPVPGGVGQCTVIALLENTIDIALKNNQK